MQEFLEILGSAALYAAAVRLLVPLLFAAIGEIFAERAGLVNVGLEAMMLMGAFGGVLGAVDTGSAVLGLIIGVACGVTVAAIQAAIAINLGGNQIVSGIALNIAVLGLTSFLALTIWRNGNVPPVPGFGILDLPALASIPFLGTVLFRQTVFVYVAIIAVPVAWWAMTRTTWGLRLRACGEDPRAVDSLGIPVLGLRWQTMLIAGALAGLGGVFISLADVMTFSNDISAGRGFIALAVVIIARWSPVKAVFAALLFGGLEALALRLQTTNLHLPTDLLLALPYVATLLVYAGVVGRTVAPAALGRSYTRA